MGTALTEILALDRIRTDGGTQPRASSGPTYRVTLMLGFHTDADDFDSNAEACEELFRTPVYFSANAMIGHRSMEAAFNAPVSRDGLQEDQVLGGDGLELFHPANRIGAITDLHLGAIIRRDNIHGHLFFSRLACGG